MHKTKVMSSITLVMLDITSHYKTCSVLHLQTEMEHLLHLCLERDADLHMAQLMPLPLTVSCFSKIQIGFTFLVPAHPGSHGQRAVKRVFVVVVVVLAPHFRGEIPLKTQFLGHE